MSADNGVYIARFPDGYRVVHAQAIENIDYFPVFSVERENELKSYFQKSEVYKTREEAYKKAKEIYSEIMEDEFAVCEYGISFLQGIYENWGKEGENPMLTGDESKFIVRHIDDSGRIVGDVEFSVTQLLEAAKQLFLMNHKRWVACITRIQRLMGKHGPWNFKELEESLELPKYKTGSFYHLPDEERFKINEEEKEDDNK